MASGSALSRNYRQWSSGVSTNSTFQIAEWSPSEYGPSFDVQEVALTNGISGKTLRQT